MISLLFVFTFGLFSNAADFDCAYTVSFQPLPTNLKYMDELREGNINSRKACNGANPCAPDKRGDYRVTYTDSDPTNSGNPSRKFEEKNLTREACAKKAEQACRIVRAGVLTSKTVTANFKGEPIFKKVCRETGANETISSSTKDFANPPARPAGAPKSAQPSYGGPASQPAASNGGTK